MSRDFLSALENRRSIYAISSEETVSRNVIKGIVASTVKNSPSAFNSQSGRVVLLFGDDHKKLWDLTTEVLRTVVPAEAFQSTLEKMNAFKGGYGTVLYFDDTSIVEGLQATYPLYADVFPIWALESAGMLQLTTWTALSDAGLGASLQHYNPLIDEAIRKEWNLAQSWKLLGQMPFGTPLQAASDKQVQPIEERLIILDK